MEPEKVTNMVGTFLNYEGTGSSGTQLEACLKMQMVSESVQVLATQVASEKVANMVGTFLTEDTSGGEKLNSV